VGKFIVAAMAVASLAVPAVSMADAPSGQYNMKGTNSNGNSVAVESSQITQNGQFVLSEQAKLGISDLVQRHMGP
jgi:hypothetical protein